MVGLVADEQGSLWGSGEGTVGSVASTTLTEWGKACERLIVVALV